MANVRLKNVWKRFGTNEVIKGIDLEIDAGEFVVMGGPSGCGKSTVLNLIAGLETLSDGDIHIGARKVNDVAPKDRDIAMVFQSYALYPTKTVRGNILFGMVTRGASHAEQDAALASVTELLHIDMLLNRMGSPSMNIVKGRVVQNGRLELEVTDAEGVVRFPVPEPLVGPAGRHLGGELYLGLRPETITRRGTQRPGTNVFAFERAIDVVEPTGPDTMLVFTLGGIEAIGRVHPQDKAPADTLFPFEVNMGRAKLFEPASGKRLR